MGHDISSKGIWTKSPVECQENCVSTFNCEYWTWITDNLVYGMELNGLCYQKYAKGQITNKYYAISGPKRCYALISNNLDYLWVIMALGVSGMSTILIIFILYKQKKKANNSNQSSNNVNTASQDLRNAESSAQDYLYYISNLSSRLQYASSDRPVQNLTSSLPNTQNSFRQTEPTVLSVDNNFENDNPPRYIYDPPTYEEAMKS